MTPGNEERRPEKGRRILEQTEQVQAHGTPDGGHDEAATLFAAVVQRHAYGSSVAFQLPEDADGRRRRDRALAKVEATADGQDRAVIDQALGHFASLGEPFSANDVNPVLPVVRKALVGPRFLAAAKRGEIVRIGHIPSTEPSSHARPVALWVRSTP